jgi:hypothetical protein
VEATTQRGDYEGTPLSQDLCNKNSRQYILSRFLVPAPLRSASESTKNSTLLRFFLHARKLGHISDLQPEHPIETQVSKSQSRMEVRLVPRALYGRHVCIEINELGHVHKYRANLYEADVQYYRYLVPVHPHTVWQRGGAVKFRVRYAFC